MTPDHAKFMAAIIGQPDDDLPRLVFADYLDERNDPLGWKIRDGLEKPNEVRVCHDSNRIILSGDFRCGIEVNLPDKGLCRECQSLLDGEGAPGQILAPGNYEVRRGLLETVRVYPGEFYIWGRELLKRHAITRVVLLQPLGDDPAVSEVLNRTADVSASGRLVWETAKAFTDRIVLTAHAHRRRRTAAARDAADWASIEARAVNYDAADFFRNGAAAHHTVVRLSRTIDSYFLMGRNRSDWVGTLLVPDTSDVEYLQTRLPNARINTYPQRRPE